MDNKNFQNLENILINSTAFLYEQLTIASLLLISFESLKRIMRKLIDDLPEFKCLLKGKKAPQNQADYLLKHQIINEEETKFIKTIFKQDRNKVAHDLLEILIGDSESSLDLEIVKKIVLIAHKIENYHIKYLSSPIYLDTREEVPFEAIGDDAVSAEVDLLHYIIHSWERYFEKFNAREDF